MQQMDQKTKIQLEHFKKAREARRRVWDAMREESSSEDERVKRKEKMRSTNETKFTALYSGSQKSPTPNLGMSPRDAGQNSEEFILQKEFLEDEEFDLDAIGSDREPSVQNINVNVHISINNFDASPERSSIFQQSKYDSNSKVPGTSLEKINITF